MAVVRLTPTDLQAIAATVHSEVGHWRDQPEHFATAVSATTDAIMNRMAATGKTATEVVNARKQYSKIHKVGGWENYAKLKEIQQSLPTISQQVAGHVVARASGAPSIVAGHQDFANPAKSTADWPNHMTTTLQVGNVEAKDYHNYGSAPGKKQATNHTVELEGFAPSPIAKIGSMAWSPELASARQDMIGAATMARSPELPSARQDHVSPPAPGGALIAAAFPNVSRPGTAPIAPAPAPQQMAQTMQGAPSIPAPRPSAPTAMLDQSNPVGFGFRISSPYGPRERPMPGASDFHEGLDFAGTATNPILGSSVLAAQSGVVTFAGVKGGYGNHIQVTHPDGTITRYSHLASMDVPVGTQVAAGAPIGTVGGLKGAPGAGTSTGPHLHFEVMSPEGKLVDPAGWLSPERQYAEIPGANDVMAGLEAGTIPSIDSVPVTAERREIESLYSTAGLEPQYPGVETASLGPMVPPAGMGTPPIDPARFMAESVPPAAPAPVPAPVPMGVAPPMAGVRAPAVPQPVPMGVPPAMAGVRAPAVPQPVPMGIAPPMAGITAPKPAAAAPARLPADMDQHWAESNMRSYEAVPGRSPSPELQKALREKAQMYLGPAPAPPPSPTVSTAPSIGKLADDWVPKTISSPAALAPSPAIAGGGAGASVSTGAPAVSPTVSSAPSAGRLADDVIARPAPAPAPPAPNGNATRLGRPATAPPAPAPVATASTIPSAGKLTDDLIPAAPNANATRIGRPATPAPVAMPVGRPIGPSPAPQVRPDPAVAMGVGLPKAMPAVRPQGAMPTPAAMPAGRPIGPSPMPQAMPAARPQGPMPTPVARPVQTVATTPSAGKIADDVIAAAPKPAPVAPAPAVTVAPTPAPKATPPAAINAAKAAVSDLLAPKPAAAPPVQVASTDFAVPAPATPAPAPAPRSTNHVAFMGGLPVNAAAANSANALLNREVPPTPARAAPLPGAAPRTVGKPVATPAAVAASMGVPASVAPAPAPSPSVAAAAPGAPNPSVNQAGDVGHKAGGFGGVPLNPGQAQPDPINKPAETVGQPTTRAGRIVRGVMQGVGAVAGAAFAGGPIAPLGAMGGKYLGGKLYDKITGRQVDGTPGAGGGFGAAFGGFGGGGPSGMQRVGPGTYGFADGKVVNVSSFPDHPSPYHQAAMLDAGQRAREQYEAGQSAIARAASAQVKPGGKNVAGAVGKDDSAAKTKAALDKAAADRAAAKAKAAQQQVTRTSGGGGNSFSNNGGFAPGKGPADAKPRGGLF